MNTEKILKGLIKINNLPIKLIISLLFLVGIIAIILFVQIKLSRYKNKYLGLILPNISFLTSILLVLGWYTFSFSTATITENSNTVDVETGEVFEEPELIEVEELDDIDSPDFLRLSYFFLLTNIPTVILVGIYRSERNKLTMRKEIEKMKIDDL